MAQFFYTQKMCKTAVDNTCTLSSCKMEHGVIEGEKAVRTAMIVMLMHMLASLGFNANASTTVVTNDVELARAIVNASAGDTIELAPGNYGQMLIIGGQYNQVIVGNKRIYKKTPILTGGVTIKSQDVNNRATLEYIDVRQSDYWQFDSLDVRPTPSGTAFIAVKLNGNDMSFKNSTVSYGDYSGWTAQDWENNAGRGVFVDGNNAVIENNTLHGVNMGIIVNHYAYNANVLNNTIDGLAGDGGRPLGDYATFEGNIFKNFRNVNGNHDDCIQSFSKTGGVIGAGSVDGVQIRGNLCIASEDQKDPLYSTPQGYASFNGEMKDWVIEDNILVSSAYHGIALGDASGTIIRNNTILDDNPLVNGEDTVWIRIDANSSGVPNLIEDNLTNIIVDTGFADLAGNVEIQYADYDNWFVDWQNGDFNLKPTAPVQNVGASGFSGGSSTVLTAFDAENTGFSAGPSQLAVPVPMSGFMALSGIAVLLGLRRRRAVRAA